MTDEEYVRKVEEALAIGQQLRDDGMSEEDIDKFFLDCQQYAYDVAIEEYVQTSGHQLNGYEREHFLDADLPNYDDDDEALADR